MTTRQIRWAFFIWLVSLFLTVALFAVYFTVNRVGKSVAFVDPVIWSEPQIGTPVDRQFDI